MLRRRHPLLSLAATSTSALTVGTRSCARSRVQITARAVTRLVVLLSLVVPMPANAQPEPPAQPDPELIAPDPLAAGEREEVRSVEQPSGQPVWGGSEQLTYFVDPTADGFTRPTRGDCTNLGPDHGYAPTHVAVGADKVFVADNYYREPGTYNCPRRGVVRIYAARDLAYLGMLNLKAWYDSARIDGLAVYRGKLYVLVRSASTGWTARDGYPSGTAFRNTVAVFDAENPLPSWAPPGNWKGDYSVDLRRLGTDSTGWAGIRFTGIDVAWGEIWATFREQALWPVGRSEEGENGRESSEGPAGVAIFDLDPWSGGLKTVVPGWSSNGPLKGVSVQTTATSWREPAIVPERNGVVVGHRVFRRGSVLPWLTTPDGVLCERYECPLGAPDWFFSRAPRGSDAPWGMRWLLSVEKDTRGAVISEYSIEPARWPSRLDAKPRDLTDPELPLPLNDLGLPAAPGDQLVKKRGWYPLQSRDQSHDSTLSDVAYNNRETRIDWFGPPAKSDWVRGTKRLNYVVSDADIFVVGVKGERWYEQARNFESIELKLDDQSFNPAKTSTLADSYFDINTPSEVPSGVHSLELDAVVGGRHVKIRNDNFRVDNQPPTGTVNPPGQYVRGTVPISGSITDQLAGPASWQLQVRPAGGATWQTLCTAQSTAATTSSHSCPWNTTTGQYPDGAYEIRARLVDRSSDGGNLAYTPIRATKVDNTPPGLTVSGQLSERSDGQTIYDDERPSITAVASDATSGARSIEVQVAGTRRAFWEQACGVGGCSMSRTYTLTPTDLPEGEHQVRVLVTDQAGLTTQQSWWIFVKRTPPDTPDEAALDSTDRPDVVKDEAEDPAPDDEADDTPMKSGNGLSTASTLECDPDDPYRVHSHFDYPVPFIISAAQGIGPLLEAGQPTPDAAVAGFLGATVTMPRMPATLFQADRLDANSGVFVAHAGGRRQAALEVFRLSAGGWTATNFHACSYFVDRFLP